MGGLYKRFPLTAVAFALCSLSVMGVPPFSGYFAKFLVVQGAVEAGHPVIAAVGLSTVLHFCPSESYELSLYGKIYTDKATVMREVTRTMHVATDHAPDVDGELRQAFGNY